MTRTIALAYSGGLDTSIIVPWLKEHYDGARIICVAADIGQGDELEGVRAKAIASGADECYIEDLRQEFVEDFIWPTLRAGAIYGRKYLLGTSMGTAAHRAPPGRGRPPRWCRCPRPRLHRQGQRSGSLRAHLRRFRAGPSGHCAVARVGYPEPRGRARVRGEAQRPGHRVAREDLFARSQHLAHLARRRSARGSGSGTSGRPLHADDFAGARAR